MDASVVVPVPVTVGGSVGINVGSGGGVLAGTISGSGMLTKTGSGTLTVSGLMNVLTGQTLTVQGAQSGADGLSKSGDGTVVWAGSGSVQGTMSIGAGSFSVQGDQVLSSVTKSGTGTLTLANSVKATGSATLSSGTTVVQGSQTLAQVTKLVVGDSGSTGVKLDVSSLGADGLMVGGGSVAQTLKGRGTIVGVLKLASNAMLAPGNSIDTQKVEGSVTFSGGIYEAEYTLSSGTLHSDLMQVITGANGSGVVTMRGGTVRPKALTRLTDFNPHTSVILSGDDLILDQMAAVESTPTIKAYLESVSLNSDDSIAGPLAAAPVGAAASGTRKGIAMTVQRLSFANLGVYTGARSQVAGALDRVVARSSSAAAAAAVSSGSSS
ncbi:MAG: hypothetical protein EBS01_07865, partial [Verrucomicrobia bacterium]|nr:hypothetical protein [Verrucomicrobiota bacterium]